MYKRLVALFLMVTLLVGAFPLTAFAESTQTQSTVDPGDVAVRGTNSFGTLLSEDIAEEETATEEAAAAYEGGYSVSDLEIAGNTAVVTYDTLEEALLVVSLYSEDGLQMLLSANTTVTADATEATVTFEGDMPQYFLASAYLLDVYDLSPLCAAYDTPIYTQEMQELLASTVEDYDEALVLQLDEDDATNFAVYQETTKIIEYAEGVNTVASIDDAAMTYVIENANEQFTGLVAGDIFAYAYSDSDILIARVSAITVDGATVTITGEDLEMEEVFSHVKIEADGGTADAEVDDSKLADGVTYLGLDSGTSTYSLRDSGEGTYKASLKYSFEALKLGGDNINVTLDGAIGYSVSVTLKYLITTSFQRIELRVKSGLKGEISVTGEASSSIPLGFLKIPVLAVAEIGFEPEFVVKFEGSVSLSFGYDATFAVVIEHGKQGWTKDAFYSAGKPEWEAEFSGKIFIGLSLSPVVAIAKGFIAEMKVTAKLGFEASLKLSTDISSNERHDCVFCSEGDISFVISLTPSIKFLKSNKLKFSVTVLNLSYKMFDLYWCTDHNEFGFSKCPHVSYLITATVVDKNGNAVRGAVVAAGEEKDVTNTNGVAEIYLPLGEYNVTATAGDEKSEYTVYADRAQKIKLKMGTTSSSSNMNGILGSVGSAGSIDGGNIVDSGTCGDNVKWTLTDSGLLTISGTGGIDDAAFSWNDNITKVLIKEGVTSIGYEAFEYCSCLTSITIPNSVTIIDNSAFWGCSSLTTVTIPDSVVTVEKFAFFGCSSLTDVTIGNSVTYIGYCSFANCSSLKAVAIPDSVTVIGNLAFSGCKSLVKYEVDENNANYCSNADGILLSKDQTELIYLPGAFVGAYDIPESVITIGNAAFSGTDLTAVTIPNSVISIGDNAFNGCSSLTAVTIPASVTSIGKTTFSWCNSLLKFEVAEENSNYSSDISGALLSKDKTTLICVPGGIQGEYVIPSHITTIEAYAFTGCSSLTSITIPESVISIGDEAFSYCSSLMSVTIPDSVTSIGDEAFCGCNNLTSITIPKSVTVIGENTFLECESLIDVTIQDGVETIGFGAFQWCSSLNEITIPGSITFVGNYAFHGCISLNIIEFEGNAPNIEGNAFYDITTQAFYPHGNETWISDVMQNYGGTITWVPYTLDENGEMVTGEATVTVAASVEEVSSVKETVAEVPTIEVSDVLPGSKQTATVAGAPVVDKIDGVDPGNTVNPDAVYGGDYTTEVTDSYTLKTASFTGLVPGQQYVLLAMVSTEVEDPLTPDNLLYIDQAEALEDGTLSFQYVQRVSTDISYVVACGASNKDLADAEITFPEMESDIQNQVVSPTVVYDGVTLTEGQDYVVVGAVSFTEVGTYTCYIRGIRNYTGLVECTYSVVEAPVIYTGKSLSLNGDIAVNFYTVLREDVIADENIRMVFNAGGKTQEMALEDALVDTQEDGSVWYRFSCSVPAKGMSDEITAQLYGTDGAIGKVMTYSVAAYYDDICQQYDREEKAELFALIESMLNYGAAAQEQFEYHTEKPANAAVTAKIPETVDASAFAHTVSGSEEKLEVAGISLILETNTTLRVFFRVTNGADIGSYTFTVDGKEVTPVQRGSLHYVELTDISAKALDESHTFTAGGITMEYSPLSYVNTVLNRADSMDANLVRVCKALYAYNQAANAYFGA